MIILYRIIYYFLEVLTWMIIINALLSWFMRPDHPIKSFLGRMVEPVVRPFRLLTRRIFGNSPLDFSPFLAVVAIQVVVWLINQLFYRVLFRLM